jgi:nitrile hydratase accessory protein
LSAEATGTLRGRDGEPPFAEAWQAQTMGIAAQLVAAGRCSAAEWSATLAEEIGRAAAAGAADDSGTYYACALAALERLVAARGWLTAAGLEARKAAWIEAYEHTPHGRPVELGAGTEGGCHQGRDEPSGR